MRNTIFIIQAFWCLQSFSQPDTAITFKSRESQRNYINNIENSVSRIDLKLSTYSNKYLDMMAKQEQKINAKLNRIDSNAAKQIFNEAQLKYSYYKQKLSAATELIDRKNNSYIPLLDSLATSLLFLNNGSLDQLQNLKNAPDIKAALKKISTLEAKLDEVENIKAFIKERKEFLTTQMTRFGMLKELRNFSKQVYYYQAQLLALKEDLNEPEKLVRKSLSVLREIPAFKQFFNTHSELASLFMLPNGTDSFDPANFPGLQTSSSVKDMIQQRMGSSGLSANASMGQQMNSIQSQLSQLRDKINKAGGSNSDFAMPDFKPNNQKTKGIGKRLELGTNFQTVRSNGFFPTTTDLGISFGYKLNDKSTAGIGIAYKIGLGDGFNKIHISHQGVGLRSFIDVKIKGNFYLTGGAEFNYRTLIREFDQLKDFSAWQKSALLGLTRAYKVGNKNQGNIQLLFDFLYNYQVPKSQPILFRVGYKL